MKEKLLEIRASALDAAAAAQDEASIEKVRIDYLGKKGALTAILRGMGALSAEERPVIGQLANEVRTAIEAALSERGGQLKAQALDRRLAAEKLPLDGYLG